MYVMVIMVCFRLSALYHLLGGILLFRHQKGEYEKDDDSIDDKIHVDGRICIQDKIPQKC